MVHIDPDTGTEPPVRRWSVDADYDSFVSCEPCIFGPDEVTTEMYDPEAGDAMLGILPDHLDGYEGKPLCSHTVSIFGNRVPMQDIHYAILSFACLAADRLGSKAFLDGEFERWECKIAVTVMNQYLDRKVNLPYQFDKEKLYDRIHALPLPEEEQRELFQECYWGEADEELSAFFAGAFWRKGILWLPSGTDRAYVRVSGR